MNTESFKIFINTLADASGEYISKHFGKSVGIDFKKDNTPVTEIDRNTELLLREMIQKNIQRMVLWAKNSGMSTKMLNLFGYLIQSTAQNRS